MINVTKTFLPSFEEYTYFLKKAWDNSWVTNNGQLLQELELKLKEYLGVKNLLVSGNGTIVLQLALKALNIKNEVITTPFSYVATTNAILWEGCKPVFVDIDSETFCIDVDKIEAAITSKTEAILATHVYGIPCDVEKIELIAKRYQLKVIYDAAHSFAVKYKGNSILNYGDVSTSSFHATKIFHTVEGGCIVCNDDELNDKLILYRSFGHKGDDYYLAGINGKNSEMHAAMGLSNLLHISEILARRKNQWLRYSELLKNSNFQFLKIDPTVSYNYAYFPIVFESELNMLDTLEELKKKQIIPRRYFYPSLNSLPYLDHQSCPVAESISTRVICLPLYHDLLEEEQDLIVEIILKEQNK